MGRKSKEVMKWCCWELIGEEFNFKKQLDNICQVAKYKLRAFQRIRKYLNTEKAKVLVNTSINDQFYFASIIWIVAGKTLILKVQKIYRRTLHVVQETYEK